MITPCDGPLGVAGEYHRIRLKPLLRVTEFECQNSLEAANVTILAGVDAARKRGTVDLERMKDEA